MYITKFNDKKINLFTFLDVIGHKVDSLYVHHN